MVETRISVPKRLRYAALIALRFGHPGINKMCSDAVIFWTPNMLSDIQKNAKTCPHCFHAGKNFKFQIPSAEKSKIEATKNPSEFQINFRGN